MREEIAFELNLVLRETLRVVQVKYQVGRSVAGILGHAREGERKGSHHHKKHGYKVLNTFSVKALV